MMKMMLSQLGSHPAGAQAGTQAVPRLTRSRARAEKEEEEEEELSHPENAGPREREREI